MSDLAASNPFVRVLTIPELKYMVTSLITGQDRLHLNSVSKALFNCTIPVIWEEVPNGFFLLSLLPLSIVTSNEANQLDKTKHVVSSKFIVVRISYP